MKKLVLLFLVLLAVVLVVGCNARRNKGEFAENETTTVVTPIDEDSSEPLSVNGAAKLADAGTLAVTSPEGGTLETSKVYNVIRGTAPKNTARIQVNDFTLTKYRPGQTRWNYIASTYINTLKPGDNSYAVKALDSTGKVIAETSFSITYNAPEVPVLPGTGSPLMTSLIVSILLTLSWFGFKQFTLKRNY
ncbi:MAG: hypothetical protein V1908_01125 [Candidatus Peregrinibacteria bacterium]